MRAREPVRLEFLAETWTERLWFAGRGRWIIRRGLRALSRASSTLPASERWRLQSAWAGRILDHLGVELTIRAAPVRAPQPAVIVALHEGIADALCLLRLGMPLRVAVREEIFAWPEVGAALTRMRHVAIDPERGSSAYRAMLGGARAAFMEGESFAVFPQGTVLGIETAFKCGAFRLAQALRAPIVPVVLTGAHRVWEHPFSARLRYGQRVAAVILEAIPEAVVSATPAQSLCRSVERAMKEIALSGQVPAPRRYVPERDGYWDGYAFEIDPRFTALAERVAQERRRGRCRHFDTIPP